MTEKFTSQQVVQLTGITLRQLQWWDERGFVVPARSGRRRLYTFSDLTEIAVISELRARGLSLQRVCKVVRFLERELRKRLVETTSAATGWHLLTDGRDVYLKNSAQQVIDVLKNARQPIFAICLSDTVRQVRADIRGLRDAPPPAAPREDRKLAKVRRQTTTLRASVAGSSISPRQRRAS